MKILSEFKKAKKKREAAQRLVDVFIMTVAVPLIFVLLVWSCVQFRDMRQSAQQAKTHGITERQNLRGK